MNRKKGLGFFLVILCILSITIPFTLATKPNGPSAENGLTKGNGKVIHLYVYQKDEDWQPVEKGAWGKMTYLIHKDKIIFNAHKLNPETDYSLINYAPGTDWGAVNRGEIDRPWPGEGSIEIASGVVNNGGNIHLAGTLDQKIDGKVWLVLSDDFDGSKMTGYHRFDYLLQYKRIQIK